MKKASGRSIYKCKVVLLGEQSVGKSSLALRFVENTFIEYNVPTIGAAYLTKKLIINDCVMKFEIWDTAGQERFHSIAPMYYRGSQAAIVVYDITKPETFDRAKAWVEELHKQANPHLVILLAGNKADLNHLRQIQKTKGDDFAKEQNLLFLETSAKTNQNIDQIFYQIGNKCPKKRRHSNNQENKLNQPEKSNNCCSSS